MIRWLATGSGHTPIRPGVALSHRLRSEPEFISSVNYVAVNPPAPPMSRPDTPHQDQREGRGGGRRGQLTRGRAVRLAADRTKPDPTITGERPGQALSMVPLITRWSPLIRRRTRRGVPYPRRHANPLLKAHHRRSARGAAVVRHVKRLIHRGRASSCHHRRDRHRRGREGVRPQPADQPGREDRRHGHRGCARPDQPAAPDGTLGRRDDPARVGARGVRSRCSVTSGWHWRRCGSSPSPTRSHGRSSPPG